MYEAPGQPFSWATIEGDQSAPLGLHASNTQNPSSVTTGSRQISMGGVWSENTNQASGSAPKRIRRSGLAQYTGDAVPICDVSGSRWKRHGGVFPAIIQISDHATLTVTETYTLVAARQAVTWPLPGLAKLGDCGIANVGN